MSDRKWTAGPWWVEVGTGEDDEGDIYVCHEGTSCTETTVVNFGMPTIEECANAHLIAAAPDLYEALLAIVQHDEYIVESGIMKPFVELHHALSALKKARGKS